jgi:hypothetical protein
MWFLYVEWQTRWVSDTRQKPDGYRYGYGFLPTGIGTVMNFYPQPLCWRTGNYSIRAESDSLTSLRILMKKKKDHKNVVQYSALLDTSTKGNLVHIALTCAGSNHFRYYVRTLSLYFYKRLFSVLEPMTFMVTTHKSAALPLRQSSPSWYIYY